MHSAASVWGLEQDVTVGAEPPQGRLEDTEQPQESSAGS